MKAEEIKLAFQKVNESKIELALTDDISALLRQAFDSSSKGVDLVKQANAQFSASIRFAQSAEMQAKEGEDKAKFLGIDASKFTALKKEATDYVKLASQNAKKYS